jgi:hypothetical protein
MSDGFHVEQDGPITIHTFTNSTESAIDTWVTELGLLIEATPTDQVFLVLMDVSSRQVSFTGYARKKSIEIFTRYKHRRGRLAFLFSSKTAPHFGRIFFASLGKLSFEREYFSNRERALDWLRGLLNS